MELGPSGPIKSRDWTRVLLPLHSPRRRPSLSWSEAASLASRGAPPLLAHSLTASALANRRYRSRGARSSTACHRPASATLRLLPVSARGGECPATTVAAARGPLRAARRACESAGPAGIPSARARVAQGPVRARWHRADARHNFTVGSGHTVTHGHCAKENCR